MKLTEEQKAKLDGESFHVEYDRILHDRLKELDAEFVEEIDRLADGEIFWYA